MKECKSCGTKFEPWNSLAKVCSQRCALDYGKKEAEAKAKRQREAERKADKKRLEELKPRAKHLKEAQQAFNAYVRERDRYQPCISCGTYNAGQFHAGHYRTTKAAPELRFNELNCQKQCAQCNTFDSGNIIEYRINLVKRIGEENVEWLEQEHEPKHYTIEDLKEIKAHYRRLTRELQKQREAA